MQHVALFGSDLADQMAHFRGRNGPVPLKAGSGASLVFAVNRCLLAFDENTAMMGSGHNQERYDPRRPDPYPQEHRA